MDEFTHFVWTLRRRNNGEAVDVLFDCIAMVERHHPQYKVLELQLDDAAEYPDYRLTQRLGELRIRNLFSSTYILQ